MRNLVLSLASTTALLAWGIGAMADPVEPAPTVSQTAPAATTADSDKVVCKAMGATTGSRLGAHRECKTQREWDDARLQSEKEISKMEAQGNLGPRGN